MDMPGQASLFLKRTIFSEHRRSWRISAPNPEKGRRAGETRASSPPPNKSTISSSIAASPAYPPYPPRRRPPDPAGAGRSRVLCLRGLCPPATASVLRAALERAPEAFVATADSVDEGPSFEFNPLCRGKWQECGAGSSWGGRKMEDGRWWRNSFCSFSLFWCVSWDAQPLVCTGKVS